MFTVRFFSPTMRRNGYDASELAGRQRVEVAHSLRVNALKRVEIFKYVAATARTTAY
jgi:hypothetical protein